MGDQFENHEVKKDHRVLEAFIFGQVNETLIFISKHVRLFILHHISLKYQFFLIKKKKSFFKHIKI